MSAVRSFISLYARKSKSTISLLSRRNFSSENEFKEQKVNVGDLQINCLKTGNGPYNLLLMPGSLGSIWTDFEPQIKGLDKKLFTIIAWDPPGYGKSIPPVREFPLNFYEKDADTALLLMRVLEIPKFSLLGWSDGGISSIILAAKYPESVNKAVIWGANTHILRTELAGYENIRDLSKWSQRMKDPMIAVYGEKEFGVLWNKWCDAMQNIYNTNRGDICMSLMEKVTCETLILHGAKDKLLHEQHIPMLKSNIPKSQLYVYPDGGHNIHLKYASDFNKRVTEFLLPK